MAIDETTREFIRDCLSHIESGEPGAVFDLASAFISCVDAKDIEINLAIIEALAIIAKNQGSTEAADFLTCQWPDMQNILRKRWKRAGFIGQIAN